ncbi:MAG: hypothetical protein U9Q81_01095 [Pseudomonadota bacterium]|nr:hypothetical protein [Pseudomonadota bacterium]
MSLLPHMYVHAATGRPIDEYRRELQAMGPLAVAVEPAHSMPDTRLIRQVICILGAEASDNADYRRLLDMLREAGLAEEPLVQPNSEVT